MCHLVGVCLAFQDSTKVLSQGQVSPYMRVYRCTLCVFTCLLPSLVPLPERWSSSPSEQPSSASCLYVHLDSARANMTSLSFVPPPSRFRLSSSHVDSPMGDKGSLIFKDSIGTHFILQ